MITPLIISVLALMHLFFMLSVLKRNFGLVDVAWGLGFIVIALVSYLHHPLSLKNALVLVMVTVWGLRLAIHLFTRNWKAPEDYRYAEMRKNWGEKANLKAYYSIFLLQGGLMLLISLPLTFGMNGEEFSLINKCGALIWLLGWSFEVYADAYLRWYKAQPQYRGTICMIGPWKVCRFPNYLGEITLWYGIYLTTLTSSNWWTILGPLTINFFIVKISGIPLLEKKYQQRPEYHEYSQRVPRLLPFRLPL